MGEIVAYREREREREIFCFLVMRVVCLSAFLLAVLFCLPFDGSGHQSFTGFFLPLLGANQQGENIPKI